MSSLFTKPVTAIGYARVAVERGVDRYPDGLTYAIPPELADIAPGDRVIVPLGKADKPTAGCVVEISATCDVDPERIKAILKRDDAAARLPSQLIALAKWISAYYCAPVGMALATMLPAAVKKNIGSVTKTMLDLGDPIPLDEKLPPRQRKVLEALAALDPSQRPIEMRRLADLAGLKTTGPIRKLLERGLVEQSKKTTVEAAWIEHAREVFVPEYLTQPQQKIIDEISPALDRGFSVHLLYGVTGSGKTEVYIRLIQQVIAQGKIALVLVPEISLTPQTGGRLIGRFPDHRVAVLHSGLTSAQRHQQWSLVSQDRAAIVLGARSAVFAPIADERIGLIIVDEEHDSSYKQDQVPRYHGRDVAIRRAQLAKCPVLLGSATPSMESWFNATEALSPSPSGRGVRGEGVQDSRPPLDPKLRDYARTLRSDQTDAERLMWYLLRDRRLGGYKFRRQHPFDPYILDFYCNEAKVAVELDGGQHNEPAAGAGDERRSAFLENAGIRVLRFWNHQVLKETEPVLEAIWNALHALTPALSQREREKARSRYVLHRLDDRVPGAKLPRVQVVDFVEQMRSFKDRRVHLIGPVLQSALAKTLESGGQAIILLNRRGYANYIACPDHFCGWVMQCNDCDVAMVYHVGNRAKAGAAPTGYVRCHHCLSEQKLPANCPKCGNRISTFGLGTQRVEEELSREFSTLIEGKTMLRVDSDTMHGSRDLHAALTRFGAGEIKVLLGTQMIAKGLDFPNVKLVGVINADTAINMPDFRATERTFQLVSQVSGRSGRGSEPDSGGRVVVQSFNPSAPAIRLAAEHRYEDFARLELKHRRNANLPPVTRLTRIVVRDKDHLKCLTMAKQLADALRLLAGSSFRLRGPAPCPIPRIAGKHRQQIEIIAPTPRAMQELLTAARNAGLLKSSEAMAVDVDALSLM